MAVRRVGAKHRLRIEKSSFALSHELKASCHFEDGARVIVSWVPCDT